MPRDWRRFEYPAYPSRLQPVFIQLITYVDGQVEPVLLKMSRFLRIRIGQNMFMSAQPTTTLTTTSICGGVSVSVTGI